MKEQITKKINKLINNKKNNIYHIVINNNKRLTKNNKSIEIEINHRNWLIKRIFKSFSYTCVNEYDGDLSMGLNLLNNYELSIHNHILVDIPDKNIVIIEKKIKKCFKIKFKNELNIEKLKCTNNMLNISGYLVKQNHIFSPINFKFQFI